MGTQILEDRFEIEQQLSHTDFTTVYLACDRRPPPGHDEVKQTNKDLKSRLENLEAKTK